MMGLSPRVRGNQGYLFRSIPASAGQPPALGVPLPVSGLSPRVHAERPGSVRWVYPRECGATLFPAAIRVSLNPVYPRECGATARVIRCSSKGIGLSPRVRGNRRRPGGADASRGSIPASAGQPHPAYGLSPRVRGNRPDGHRQPLRPGSIPASAGQPLAACKAYRRRWVYPRECGATRILRSWNRSAYGLSPRVRGNPAHCKSKTAPFRSIPASAGQPPCLPTGMSAARVYPRECGATGGTVGKTRQEQGLSPRVRGKAGPGSIPASAGQPSPGPA